MTYDSYDSEADRKNFREPFVRLLASTVPNDLDIADERELLLHLHRLRVSAKECIDLVDDVANEVRARRANALDMA